jgi:hypothetical protein
MARKARNVMLRGASIVAALALAGVFLVTCLPHPWHLHGKEGACSICQVGRLPFLEPAVSAAFTPIHPISWVERPERPVAPREVPICAGSSRAPPA